MRTYALAKLGEAAEPLYQAHAQHFANLADHLQSFRGGPRHAEGLQKLAAERGNLNQALETFQERSDWSAALRLTGNLGWYWEACSLLEEGTQAIEAVLPKAQDSLALCFLGNPTKTPRRLLRGRPSLPRGSGTGP